MVFQNRIAHGLYHSDKQATSELTELSSIMQSKLQGEGIWKDNMVYRFNVNGFAAGGIL